LNCVARKVRSEWFIGERHYLSVVSALSETDERVTRYFISKTGATIAQDAAFAIKKHQFTNWDWLFVVTLLFNKATLTCTMAEGLVLQWAFPTFVSHWAIKWVIRKK
jgi:hypothetical protein